MEVERGPEPRDWQHCNGRVEELNTDKYHFGLPALRVEHLPWLEDAVCTHHTVHPERDPGVRWRCKPADRSHQLLLLVELLAEEDFRV